ncbi:MAG: 1-acyl-sn-glycerol-3-phosphate acyltransferase [Trueperaceae bacterium]|nr:MAG: 1-acyl-sn-glycerol-3-phosphate acyltransferase [Trueperaceae bacterium]
MKLLERLVQGLWFYWFVRATVFFYSKVVFGLTIIDAEKVPRSGGLVVASNHFTAWDPFVMGVSVPREIDFMAKKELFENPFMRVAMIGMRAFPVDRERNDLTAVRHALRLLKAGTAVGIFPQGTRGAPDTSALDGAAFLAQRASVPLQPVTIWRQGRSFHVRFGDPILPVGRDREALSAMTQKLMQRIDELTPTDDTAIRGVQTRES